MAAPRLGAALCEALNLKNVVRIELDLSLGREELRVTFGLVDDKAAAIVETLKHFDIVERPAPAAEAEQHATHELGARWAWFKAIGFGQSDATKPPEPPTPPAAQEAA